MLDKAKKSMQFLQLQYTYFIYGGVDYWNQKGLNFIADNNTVEALECFEKALIEDRKNIFAIQNKIHLLSSQKKFTEAINCCNELIVLDSENIGWYRVKACILEDKKDYHGVISNLDIILKSNDTLDFIWTHKARVLYALDQHEQALNCCNKALEINKKKCGSS